MKHPCDPLAGIRGRWNDSLSPATQAGGLSALTYEEREAGGILKAYYFRDGQTDVLHYSNEVGHSWDFGPVRAHMHWVPMGDPVAPQVVRFRYTYAWDTMAGGTAEVTGTADITVNPGDVGKEFSSHLVTVTPPANVSASTFFHFSVARLGADAADTYNTAKPFGTAAANVRLLGGGIHYQAARYGTNTETA